MALLLAAFAFGRVGMLTLFAFASFFALREFVTLTPTRSGDYVPLVLSFFVLLPAQYVLIARAGYGMFAIFIPVYAFLLLPAVAAFAAEQLQHHALRLGALGDGVAMAAMIRRDAVILAQVRADAGRDTLLADGDMQRPGNFPGLVRRERGLLEGADARHRAVEVSEAAQVVARIRHGRPYERARLAREGSACLNTPQETSTRQNKAPAQHPLHGRPALG